MFCSPSMTNGLNKYIVFHSYEFDKYLLQNKFKNILPIPDVQ